MAALNYQIAYAYLVDGWSMRDIEKQILGLPAEERGGGFVAKKALNSMGIEGKDKGCLSHDKDAEQAVRDWISRGNP